jgi:hypothetical protein
MIFTINTNGAKIMLMTFGVYEKNSIVLLIQMNILIFMKTYSQKCYKMGKVRQISETIDKIE